MSRAEKQKDVQMISSRRNQITESTITNNNNNNNNKEANQSKSRMEERRGEGEGEGERERPMGAGGALRWRRWQNLIIFLDNKSNKFINIHHHKPNKKEREKEREREKRASSAYPRYLASNLHLTRI